MLSYVVVALCVAQIVIFAKHWLRVTGRERDASSLRRLRNGLDWSRSGHGSRIRAGVSRFGEVRGQ